MDNFDQIDRMRSTQSHHKRRGGEHKTVTENSHRNRIKPITPTARIRQLSATES